MADRKAQDPNLRAKRIKDHVKVLRFLLESLRSQVTGKLESPQKLAVFFAGYIAMRRMWEVNTESGKFKNGDAEIRELSETSEILRSYRASELPRDDADLRRTCRRDSPPPRG